MTFEIPIGERIRFYRGRRRQVDVAALAHVSVDYLSEIERGKKMPAIPVMYRFAEILGVPIAALLG